MASNFPFKINNIPLDGSGDLPALKYQGASYSRQAIDSSATGRNQQGTMIREQVASKDKWQLEFVPCEQAKLGKLLSALDSASFSFTYPDPLYGSGVSGHTSITRTATFYCGDRSAPVFLIEHTPSTTGASRKVGLWGNLKFNVIEL